MTFNPTDFLHSLAKYIVARAGAFTPPVAIQYAGTPRQLWRQRATENTPGGPNVCADPYTVMRVYSAPPLMWYPLIKLSVQFQTVASDSGGGDEGGLAQAWIVFRTLLDDQGHPARMLAVNAFKAADDAAHGSPYTLVALDPLQRPGLVGRDDRGRALWTWNAEIEVRKSDDQTGV